MNIMSLIRSKRAKSASTAKERLSIIISHERTKRNDGDFLPKLKQEIIQVIGKYVELDEEQINIEMHREENHSTIEMNIVVPELVAEEA